MNKDDLMKTVVLELGARVRQRVEAEVKPKIQAEVAKIIDEEVAATAVSIARWVKTYEDKDNIVIEVRVR